MASSEYGGTDKEHRVPGMERGCRSIQDRSTALTQITRSEIMLMTPDPTFYPSPTMAVQAPPETLGYVALINPLEDGRSDALAVVELDPASPSYGQIVGRTDMPQAGDELHHFG